MNAVDTQSNEKLPAGTVDSREKRSERVRGICEGVQLALGCKYGEKNERYLRQLLSDYVNKETETQLKRKHFGVKYGGDIVLIAARQWYRDTFGTRGGERRPHAGKLGSNLALRALVSEFHARRAIEARHGLDPYESEPDKVNANYEYWAGKRDRRKHSRTRGKKIRLGVIEKAGGSVGLLKRKNVEGLLPELMRTARVIINAAAARKILSGNEMKGKRFVLYGPIDYGLLMVAIKLWPKRKQWFGWGGPRITFAESGEAKMSPYKDTGPFYFWIDAVETGIETMLERGEALHDEAETIKAARANLNAYDEAHISPADLEKRKQIYAHIAAQNAVSQARAELERAQAHLDGLGASKGGAA